MSISKLYECMKTKKVNSSHAREAIYTVLMKSDNCICVSEIIHNLKETYPKKVSLNTIYRHLTLFVECGLAVVIQDDFKKAYYALTGEKANVFLLCPKCNALTKAEESCVEDALERLDKHEFITIHKKCEKCQGKM